MSLKTIKYSKGDRGQFSGSILLSLFFFILSFLFIFDSGSVLMFFFFLTPAFAGAFHYAPPPDAII